MNTHTPSVQPTRFIGPARVYSPAALELTRVYEPAARYFEPAARYFEPAARVYGPAARVYDPVVTPFGGAGRVLSPIRA